MTSADKTSAETHIYPKITKQLRQNIHQSSRIISLWTLPTNLHIYNFDLAFFQCNATDFLWGGCMISYSRLVALWSNSFLAVALKVPWLF